MEGETPLTKRKEGRAERAFITLRAIPIALLFLLGVMRGRHPDREFDKKDSSPPLLLLHCSPSLRRIPGLSLYVSVRNCLCCSSAVCLLCSRFRKDGALEWRRLGHWRGLEWTDGRATDGLVVNPESSLTNPIHAMPEAQCDGICT